MKRIFCVLALTTLAIAALAAGDPPFHPDIPKAWDDVAVESMELPLAQRDRSPRYMSSAEYYALHIRPIYRSYPVYAPGREPAGYLDSLKQKDARNPLRSLQTPHQGDWIRAGKLVFESDTVPFPPAAQLQPNPPRSPPGAMAHFRARPRLPLLHPSKGSRGVGCNSCAGCHTRSCPTAPFSKEARANPLTRCARIDHP